MRQEAVLVRAIGWKLIEFKNANVVEIGCGPLGGYAPLSIFLGAKSFVSAEPEWDQGLFESDEISDGYLYPLHADLCALYGERMDFPAFRKGLRQRVRVYQTGFESLELTTPADIVLSQSCLEHVFPLDGTIEKLAQIQTPLTRFIHLVDFGNHYLTNSPFDGLYEDTAAAYIARRGKAINMCRLPDVTGLFESSGLPAVAVPTRFVPDTYNGRVDEWWRERYDDAALFTQLALIAGPSP